MTKQDLRFIEECHQLLLIYYEDEICNWTDEMLEIESNKQVKRRVEKQLTLLEDKIIELQS